METLGAANCHISGRHVAWSHRGNRASISRDPLTRHSPQFGPSRRTFRLVPGPPKTEISFCGRAEISFFRSKAYDVVNASIVTFRTTLKTQSGLLGIGCKLEERTADGGEVGRRKKKCVSGCLERRKRCVRKNPSTGGVYARSCSAVY